MTIEPSIATSERSETCDKPSRSLMSETKQGLEGESSENFQGQEIQNEQAAQEGQSGNESGGKGLFQSKRANLLDASISKNAKSATLRKAKRPPTKAHIQSTISVTQMQGEKELEEKKIMATEPAQMDDAILTRVAIEPSMEAGKVNPNLATRNVGALSTSSPTTTNASANESENASTDATTESPEVQSGKSSAVLLAKQLAFGAGAVKLRSTGRKDLVGLQRLRDLDKEVTPLSPKEQAPSSPKMTLANPEQEQKQEQEQEQEQEQDKKEKVVAEESKSLSTALHQSRPLVDGKGSIKVANSQTLPVESKPQAKVSPTLSNAAPVEVKDEKPILAPSRTKSPPGSMEPSNSPSKALAKILHPGKSSLETEVIQNEPTDPMPMTEMTDSKSVESHSACKSLTETEVKDVKPLIVSASASPEISNVPPVSSPPHPVMPSTTTAQPNTVVASESPFDPTTAVAGSGFQFATCIPSCAAWFRFGSKSKQRSGSKSPSNRAEAASQSSSSSSGSGSDLNSNPVMAMPATVPIAIDANHA